MQSLSQIPGILFFLDFNTVEGKYFFSPTYGRTPICKTHWILTLKWGLLPICIQCAEMWSFKEVTTLHEETSQSAQVLPSKTDNVKFFWSRGLFERFEGRINLSSLDLSFWVPLTVIGWAESLWCNVQQMSNAVSAPKTGGNRQYFQLLKQVGIPKPVPVFDSFGLKSR